MAKRIVKDCKISRRILYSTLFTVVYKFSLKKSKQETEDNACMMGVDYTRKTRNQKIRRAGQPHVSSNSKIQVLNQYSKSLRVNE